jgi:hypothetical protein
MPIQHELLVSDCLCPVAIPLYPSAAQRLPIVMQLQVAKADVTDSYSRIQES